MEKDPLSSGFLYSRRQGCLQVVEALILGVESKEMWQNRTHNHFSAGLIHGLQSRALKKKSMTYQNGKLGHNWTPELPIHVLGHPNCWQYNTKQLQRLKNEKKSIYNSFRSLFCWFWGQWGKYCRISLWNIAPQTPSLGQKVRKWCPKQMKWRSKPTILLPRINKGSYETIFCPQTLLSATSCSFYPPWPAVAGALLEWARGWMSNNFLVNVVFWQNLTASKCDQK